MNRYHYEPSTWRVETKHEASDGEFSWTEDVHTDLDGFGVYDRKLSGLSTDNWIAFCVDRGMAERIVEALNAVDESPDGKVSTFRYVPHGKVQEYLKKGWTMTPALEGTSHGQWSCLMRAPA